MEILKFVLVAVPALFVILSGVFKLVKNKKVVETLAKAGVGKYIPLLGVAEIIFALLFLYPPTRNIGFILLVCYFSGALAVDLSHKSPLVAPFVFLVLLFVAQYVNNPALFF